jgi:flavin-dependent dehydrogenase
VLGAGVAGLSAALALARDGRRVTVVERDDVATGEPLDSIHWDRKGIPHFLQAHAFTPRGRKELKATFPDVFEALINAGAWDLDLRPKIHGGEANSADEDLVFLAVRRPLIEWALRRAALAEPGISFIGGTRVTGLVAGRIRTGPPVVRGVDTTSGRLEADLVIDALGRRTPTPDWIEAIGGAPMDERSNDCSIIYYSRYYQVREGASLPEVPSIPGPRGDLGYAAFTTFPGDNGTFCALIAIPPGDQALKVLRDARAYEAATATLPALNLWTNVDTSTPITDVLPMGSLQNVMRSFRDSGPPTLGLISIGDTICHTDPVASLGLVFALIQARLLRDALRDHGADAEATAIAFDALARPEMEERFDYVSAIDDTRTRLWAGERFDYTHADGGVYPFFSYAATGIAPLADGDVARTLIRRNYFLDPLSTLDTDAGMQRRLEAFYAEIGATPRPTAGPNRDELIEVMTAATA